jgi:voltage-gated potassium channel
LVQNHGVVMAETGVRAARRKSSARTLQQRLRHLYEGESAVAYRFRYALLAFDLLTVAFIVATSFLPRLDVVEVFDVLFGLVILADFSARFLISRTRLRDLAHPATWADAIAIVSFLAPLAGEAAGFLRVLRTLRLLHTYQLLKRMRADFPRFRRHEELLITIVHLGVFLFVMSAIVYETQHWTNDQIRNYVDALYFTVTALTTTGFGDITLAGTSGRLISIVIMIFGVTLFLRLVRALLQPHKVRFPCPTCGLQRHDRDAVHCKACGELLNIPNDDWTT